MNEHASQFVGDIPSHYDAGLGPIIFEDFANELAKQVAAYSPKRILELAAGTGIVSVKLADQLVAGGALVVTDLNEPMLAVAANKIDARTGVNLLQADAMSLQFDDSAFDMVACQFGVMFFPDKVKSYRETHRVLTPGGRFVFNAWGTIAANPFAQIVQDLSEELFPEAPPEFYRVPFSYPDPNIATRDLMRAGFENIEHEKIRINKDVPSWSDFARGLVFGNPLFHEITARKSLSPSDVQQMVEDRMQKSWGPAPASMPLEAHFYSAQKA